MGSAFASGRHSIAECDRCGFRYKLKELRKETIKGKVQNLLVCATCWNPDHPQLQVGLLKIDDPQGVRDARSDKGFFVSGPLAAQVLGAGNRVIQWGWNPVGGATNSGAAKMTPNALSLVVIVGGVTVLTT